MSRGANLLARAPQMLAGGEQTRLEREVRELCEREPDNARAQFVHGAALHALGRLPEALDAFERSDALAPGDAQVLSALAGILHALGHLTAADKRLAAAIVANPGDADLQVNRAIVLEDLGRADEALTAYRHALELQPENARALQNLPVLLSGEGRLDEALQACEALLRVYPDHAAGHANQGNLLLARRDFEAALAASTRAVELAPGHARAHADRALALAVLGRFDASREAARRAVSLAPEVLRTPEGDQDAPPYPDPRVVYLLTGFRRLQRCDWHDFERQCSVFEEVAADPHLRTALADQMALLFRSYVLPVPPASRGRLARATGRRIAELAAARLWVGGGEPVDGGKIRIGYLGSEFRVHPGATLLLPVLLGHDRERFHVTAYATNPDDGSRMRARMRDAVDRFVELHEVDDHEAAWRIRESGCDLLVFRDGYTQLGRPGILAQHPAPLQLNWAGYHGTLGGGLADYHVSEVLCDPPGDAHLWDEARLYLPCGPLNFPYAATPVPVAPRRETMALPPQAPVLAAMHRPEKIDPQLFEVWMRLLDQLPGSVLWMLDDDGNGARGALCAHAERHDVAPARLVFAAKVGIDEHLRRLAAADLWLDTRWYGSHTTLMDALAAGVPAVTCTGNAVQGRIGATILHAAGLHEQVTHRLEDYEQAVLRLATDPAERGRLREQLCARQASLFDVTAFVRALEDGFARIWRRHLGGLEPCDTFAGDAADQRLDS